MNGWFVVKSQHQRERWACENIVRQGAQVYLPYIMENNKLKPLFPGGYLFVKTQGSQWRFLLGTFGVLSIIQSAGGPAVVRDVEIDKLRARENSDGYVVLPKRKGQPEERFKAGEAVRVAGGHFSGYKGIYEGLRSQDRQQVLLDYLGNKMTVLIPDEDLELA